MSSGKYIDLSNLTVNDIDINDINNSLNYTYRFTGHHKDRLPLTTAQHTKLCVHIAKILYPDEKDVHLDCCLHDWEESVLSDISTPMKRIIGNVLDNYTDNVAKLIYDKYWVIDIPYTEDTYSKRKIVDTMSLDIERRSMWRSQNYKELWPNIPNENWISLKEKQELFDEIQSIRIVDLPALYNSIIKDNNI